jgi:hypothetical protein
MEPKNIKPTNKKFVRPKNYKIHPLGILEPRDFRYTYIRAEGVGPVQAPTGVGGGG